MKVLAVSNQKGGVGKTTTAVNLAACLGACERKTLLIDMDSQCNCTTGIGIDKNDVAHSSYDVLVGECSLQDAVVSSPGISYLDVVPGSVNLAGLELELASAFARERKLSAALEELSGYDYVVVDSPPSLGLITVNIMAAVDSVLIPIQCEYYALEGLAELLNTIRLVQKKLNSSLTIEGVLLTMYDARLNLSRQVVNDVKSYFSGNVFETIIPRNVKLSESPSFGKSIIEYDVMSKGAVAYRDLANELISNSEKSDHEQ
ncbi:MAG: ParA family protein [Fibrobacterota bacterium]